MANDYPLEELGPRAFEQLTVALSMKVFGPGVEAFGSGPDGGREATFQGRVDWSKTDVGGEGSWDGFTVIQAKQCEHPLDPGWNLKWLTKQVDNELDSWMRDASKRGRFPDFLIFVTNVRLSSVPSAGIDRINDHIRRRLTQQWEGQSGNTLQARGLQDWRVWHRDQLNGLLTMHGDVRQAFKGLLTVGDLMARLGALGGLLDPDQLVPVLKAHAMNSIAGERWVSFREAGGTSRESVENVIIDLQVGNENRERSTVLREVFRRSDAVLKPSVSRAGARRHLVLTGQAGSGKSTITRFLAQAFRAQFIADEVHTPTVSDVIQGTNQALERLAVEPPRGRRWPIRVNLAEFADAVGPDGATDLMRWLSEKVSAHAELDLKPHTLRKWLTYWPCVVLLDGLDEVTSPEVRPRVLDEITHFVEQLEQDDADLLVLVTTRPTGYNERLMPSHFQQLDLTYLDAEQAIDYGRLVTVRRLADDLDRRNQLVKSFEKSATQPTMLRLMKTPLQVLIMTIILERAGTLPADRFQLFSRYFETIYERESAKVTNLAPLLAQQRAVIIDLHEAAGLTLQIQSESSGDARALLTKADLRGLLDARLEELGHESGLSRDRIADQIIQATTERLVLLVPAEHDTVAFEIRSLQELMAARALANGPDKRVRERLELAAPSPHWRNAWVFMAGSLFAQGADHRRELVVDLIETIDTTASWPGWLSPIGPELAAALLDDGLAVQVPKWQRRLTDVALRAVSGPFPPDVQAVAAGLAAAAAADSSLRMHIRNTLKLGLSGTPAASTASRLLLMLSGLDAFVPEALMRGGEPVDDSLMGRVSVADALTARISEMPDPTEAAALLKPILDELKDVQVAEYGSGEVGIVNPTRVIPWDGPFVEAVTDPDAGAQLELLIGALDPQEWRAAHGLSILYRVAASRRPLGARLT